MTKRQLRRARQRLLYLERRAQYWGHLEDVFERVGAGIIIGGMILGIICLSVPPLAYTFVAAALVGVVVYSISIPLQARSFELWRRRDDLYHRLNRFTHPLAS